MQIHFLRVLPPPPKRLFLGGGGETPKLQNATLIPKESLGLLNILWGGGDASLAPPPLWTPLHVPSLSKI